MEQLCRQDIVLSQTTSDTWLKMMATLKMMAALTLVAFRCNGSAAQTTVQVDEETGAFYCNEDGCIVKLDFVFESADQITPTLPQEPDTSFYYYYFLDAEVAGDINNKEEIVTVAVDGALLSDSYMASPAFCEPVTLHEMTDITALVDHDGKFVNMWGGLQLIVELHASLPVSKVSCKLLQPRLLLVRNDEFKIAFGIIAPAGRVHQSAL